MAELLINEFIKDPDSVLDYTFDWATWLVADTISSDTVTAPVSGLVKDSDSNDTTTVTVWLSAGVAGTDYNVISEIVTAAGRTAQRTMVIKVRER